MCNFSSLKSTDLRVFLIFIVLVLIDCAMAPPEDYEFHNPIFPDSYFIETGVPGFGETVSSTPTFTWRVTRNQLVFLGVFTENIVVKNNSIVNAYDIVWAWHSGLGTGREGNVFFSDGLNVVNGELQDGTQPTPLQNGQGYSWAVWAWDYEGKEITDSSQEMFFYVASGITTDSKLNQFWLPTE